jgi:hypothetical protein
MTDSQPERAPGLSVEEIDGEYVVLDRRAGRVHQLNETAGFVWKRLDGEHSVAQIVEALCREYDVPEAQAREDVGNLIDMFRSQEMLKGSD